VKSYQQFFAELRRWRVFRVMAGYGIIGFGIIEAAEAIFPRVALPDWAVLLAWAFDSTPEGMKRTEDATPTEISEIIAQPASTRWSSGLLALAGVVLLFGGWWMGQRAAPNPGSASESTPVEARFAFADLADDSRPSIAVLPFVNMSADEEQDLTAAQWAV
jgi:hypothetical protein